MAERTTGTLIIAEKPSAAGAIADALGGFRAGRDCLTGQGITITWAVGHLVQLAEPDHYDARLKRWRLEDLPILPAAFALVPSDEKQLKVIGALARSARELVNACDAGREGELIFGYIYRYLQLRQPVRRLWAASLTGEAIREAYGAMRPGDDYARLYRAAECRSRGDWLTGINATRAFSRRFGDLLSVGRVQTPTLAMIVHRDREIAAFIVKPYWQIGAQFTTPTRERYPGLWEGKDGNRIWDEPTAKALAECIRRVGKGRIAKVDRRETEERPPQLFDLTSLQREANRRFGLTAAGTLAAAQALYEAKLISYPRTDSRYLPTDMVSKLPGLVTRIAGQPAYASLAEGGSVGQIRRWGRRVVNNGGVTDHHAIIPTGETPRGLSGAAVKVYDLVARRLLMQLYPSARYAEVDVETLVDGERFLTHGRTLLSPGWRVCESSEGRGAGRGRGSREEAISDGIDAPGSEGDERPLLAIAATLASGQEVAVADVTIAAKATEPPRPYTDATLLAAMEGAGRELADDELREAMKRHGLGTPATRASIIERLRDVGCIERRGRQLRATEKGCQLVDAVASVGAPALLSPELTGEWERRIAEVQTGEYDPDVFEREIADLVRDVVARVKDAPEATSLAAEPAGPVGACPRCGGPVSHQGRAWTCGTAGCDFSLPGYLCRRVMKAEEIAVLLKGAKTAQLTGFRSRAGKAFKAALSLSGDKLEWHFAPRRRRDGAAGQTAPTGEGGTGARRAGGSRRRTGIPGKARASAAKPGKTKRSNDKAGTAEAGPAEAGPAEAGSAKTAARKPRKPKSATANPQP